MELARLREHQEKLLAFVNRFLPDLGRERRCHWCAMYLSGLLLDGERKSVQPMAERLPGGNEQAMQQFVSDSPWDHEALLDRLVDVMGEEIRPSSGVLVLDDTSLPKKGTHSVGVARQYCGALGKTASCQALVSVHVAGEDVHFPVWAELYLPREWTDDPERMETAGVPKEKRVFREKGQIGLSLLDKVRHRVPHRAVVCDAGYGDNGGLRAALDEREEPFVVQVKEATTFWPQDVPAAVPAARTGRGRPRSVPAPADPSVKPLSGKAWRERLLARGASFERVRLPLKAPRTAEAMGVRVRERGDRQGRRPGAERWLLIERIGTHDYRYWVSNLPADTAVDTMIALAHRRWTVEQGYQQLKEELGLDHFEGRSWQGLHHHIAICFLAFGFLVLLQKESGEKKVDPAGGPEGPQRPVPGRAVPPLRKLA